MYPASMNVFLNRPITIEIYDPQQAKRNEHPSFDSGFYVFQNTCLCTASVEGVAFNVRPNEFLNYRTKR